MANNINFHTNKAAQKTESWWARESSVLGRVVTTVIGVSGIVGAVLLANMLVTLPSDIAEHYLLALVLVSVLFGIPMLVKAAAFNKYAALLSSSKQAGKGHADTGHKSYRTSWSGRAFGCSGMGAGGVVQADHLR